MNWADAFLAQAKSDLSVYVFLKRRGNDVPVCHKLHYFLMFAEKISKSFLCDPINNTCPDKHHYFLNRALRAMKLNPSLYQAMDYSDHREFVRVIERLLPAACCLEQVIPSPNIYAPNVEYPWEDKVGSICVIPSDYNFNISTWNLEVFLIKLMKYLEK